MPRERTAIFAARAITQFHCQIALTERFKVSLLVAVLQSVFTWPGEHDLRKNALSVGKGKLGSQRPGYKRGYCEGIFSCASVRMKLPC